MEEKRFLFAESAAFNGGGWDFRYVIDRAIRIAVLIQLLLSVFVLTGLVFRRSLQIRPIVPPHVFCGRIFRNYRCEILAGLMPFLSPKGWVDWVGLVGWC